MRKIRLQVLIFSFSLFSLPIYSQKPTSLSTIKVVGKSGLSLILNLDSLKSIPWVSVSRKDKEGKEHQYRGVPVYKLLQKVGTPIGKELRGENLEYYVLIRAADGYQVIFSLPELDPEFSESSVILATEADGKPLSGAEGSYKIVVQKDKKLARCVRMVTELRVQSSR